MKLSVDSFAMEREAGEKCLTCFGLGMVSGISGLEDCPDCAGLGLPPSETVRIERQLRTIESRAAQLNGEVKVDTEWLVFEVRRARHALMQIFSVSQELDQDDALVKKLRFLANGALGMYAVESRDGQAPQQ
jgi:hypothetical protein